MIHLYKTSTSSKTVGSRVKSNARNNLIYGQHRSGKGRNIRGIITARYRWDVISVYIVRLIFDRLKNTYLVEL